MNPTEKAKELYSKMHAVIETPSNKLRKQRAKETAIVCVDEILYYLSEIGAINSTIEDFWNDVKVEISNI